MKDASSARTGTRSDPLTSASEFRYLGRRFRVDCVGLDRLDVRELATGAYLSIRDENGIACRLTIEWMRAAFESGQLIPCNMHLKSGAPRTRRILSIAV